MYKLTKMDGTDFYSGTVNYAENIGNIIRVKDYDPPEAGPSGRGLHASRNPNDCFIGATIPCRAFKVKGIDLLAEDLQKSRYRALKVIEKITDLDQLFGWRYSEAVNPIDPFKIEPPKITRKHLRLLRKWVRAQADAQTGVWNSTRDTIRDTIRGNGWNSVWTSVRDKVWTSVWDKIWGAVRDDVWADVRANVWLTGWDNIWLSVRDDLRDDAWDSLWNLRAAYCGSLFPNIENWKYIHHTPGKYPFQPAVDLLKMGLVPSYFKKKWHLHGGPDGQVLWTGRI